MIASSKAGRLVRLITEPTPQNLATLARTRRQELDGFIEGLFNGEDQSGTRVTHRG